MIKIGKSIPDVSFYSYQPNTREELKDIIEERIKSEGLNCDLNDIDVSKITDMSRLFFFCSKFDGDISKWNVSNAKDMSTMFSFSKFNGDISRWNTSNVTNMKRMFYRSEFNRDISDWNVSNVEDMSGMFNGSKFNGDISRWNIRKDCNTYKMVFDCPIKKEYKPKSPQSI